MRTVPSEPCEPLASPQMMKWLSSDEFNLHALRGTLEDGTLNTDECWARWTTHIDVLQEVSSLLASIPRAESWSLASRARCALVRSLPLPWLTQRPHRIDTRGTTQLEDALSLERFQQAARRERCDDPAWGTPFLPSSPSRVTLSSAQCPLIVSLIVGAPLMCLALAPRVVARLRLVAVKALGVLVLAAVLAALCLLLGGSFATQSAMGSIALGGSGAAVSIAHREWISGGSKQGSSSGGEADDGSNSISPRSSETASPPPSASGARNSGSVSEAGTTPSCSRGASDSCGPSPMNSVTTNGDLGAMSMIERE